MNTYELLTPKDVAAWLQTSVDWVQAHATRKQPRLTCIRVGKLLRFRREDIERFLTESVEGQRVQ